MDATEYELKRRAMYQLSLRLQVVMHLQGVTISDLSRQAGLSHTIIYNYRRANCGFTVESVGKIAHALNVSSAFLLGQTFYKHEHFIKPLAFLEERISKLKSERGLELAAARDIGLATALRELDRQHIIKQTNFVPTSLAPRSPHDDGSGKSVSCPENLVIVSNDGKFYIPEALVGAGFNQNALQDYNSGHIQTIMMEHIPMRGATHSHKMKLRDRIVYLASTLAAGTMKSFTPAICKVTGLSTMAVYNAIRGERYPQPKTLFLLACALHTLPQYLEDGIIVTQDLISKVEQKYPAPDDIAVPDAPPVEHRLALPSEQNIDLKALRAKKRKMGMELDREWDYYEWEDPDEVNAEEEQG